jgi:hypothetical protein
LVASIEQPLRLGKVEIAHSRHFHFAERSAYLATRHVADGSQRLLIANKVNAPLDNNTSLVLKGDVLCTADSVSRMQNRKRQIVRWFA